MSITKIADRPHAVSVWLSILALIISGGSAYFSHQSLTETRENRRLNTLTSEAAIQIVSVKRVTPGRKEYPEWDRMPKNMPESQLSKGFDVTLRNSGKGVARAVSFEYLTTIAPPMSEAKDTFTVYLPDMAPGQESVVSAFFFPGTDDSRRIEASSGEFELEGNLSFSDGISGVTKTQRFCYSIFAGYLNGPARELKTCQSSKPY